MAGENDFDAFYANTYRKLVGQVFAMVGDRGEAEDAVQEAYCRSWQRWDRLRDYGNPEAWIRTVAYRIAISSLAQGHPPDAGAPAAREPGRSSGNRPRPRGAGRGTT